MTVVRRKDVTFCRVLTLQNIQHILETTDTVLGTRYIKIQAVLSLKLTDPGVESSKCSFRVLKWYKKHIPFLLM